VPALVHRLVELHEVGVGDETLAELLVEVPLLVEDRDAGDLGLERGGDGHRSGSLGEVHVDAMHGHGVADIPVAAVA
jgi:hypothetical protein